MKGRAHRVNVHNSTLTIGSNGKIAVQVRLSVRVVGAYYEAILNRVGVDFDISAYVVGLQVGSSVYLNKKI